MAKQTFTTGQVLTAAQMTSLQQTAMLGGSASAKVASYTLVAADAGTAITMSNASATTITVNTSLFAAGDTVQITNIGAGVCTITAGTATVNTSASLALAQYESGTLIFISTSSAVFVKGAAASSTDNWALVSSTNLPTGAASLTISGIPLRKSLMILCNSIQTPASSVITMRINGDTGANYTANGSSTEASAAYTPNLFTGGQFHTQTSFTLLRNNNGAGNEGVVSVILGATNSTGFKTFQTTSAGMPSGGGNTQRAYQMFGVYLGTSVVSSITLTSSTGNFASAQPVLIYGTV